MALVLKAFSDSKVTFDDSTMVVKGWTSAPTVDTDGEVIDGSAFDTSTHRQYPVFLWSHDRKLPKLGDFVDGNGNYSIVSKSFPSGGNGLWTDGIKFSRNNPASAIIYGMYRDKELTSFSCGFMPGTGRKEKSGGRMVTRYTSAQLIEVSAVNIPANLDAIAKIVEKGSRHGEKLPDYLKAAFSAYIPRQKYFIAGGVLKKSLTKPAVLAHLPQNSVKTFQRTIMADATNTETPKTETPVEVPLPEIVTKSLNDFAKFKEDGSAALGELQEIVTKQNAAIEALTSEITELKTKSANLIARDEYDADINSIQSTFVAVSEGKKVKVAA